MSKKLGLAIIVLLLFVATTAQMWIRQGSQAQEWTVGHAGIGASLTEVKAVPATGGQHHITLIMNQSTTSTANQWSIESGTGTNCATATTAVLPASSVSEKYVGATNAQAVQIIPLTTPIHVTPGHAICVLGIATQLSRINIVGYTTP